MNADEIRARIKTDPDFVNLKRFDFSLEQVVKRYPDGATVRVIAGALMIAEAEVPILYEQIVQKLRVIMAQR